MEFPEYSILSFPLAHDTYVRLVLESLKLHHCLEPFHRVRESERRPVPRLYYPARRSALWDFISFSFRRSRPFSVVSLAGSVPVSPCLVWHVKYDKYVRWTSRWETQLICKDLVIAAMPPQQNTSNNLVCQNMDLPPGKVLNAWRRIASIYFDRLHMLRQRFEAQRLYFRCWNSMLVGVPGPCLVLDSSNVVSNYQAEYTDNYIW